MASTNCPAPHGDDQNKQKEKPSDKGNPLEPSSYGASFRSLVASSLAPTYELGYMNILKIKDLYDALQLENKNKKEEKEGEKDLKSTEYFPGTVTELLRHSKDDGIGFKKISETDYSYLLGSLEMLYAIRKMQGSVDVPMPPKLKEILTVKEFEAAQDCNLPPVHGDKRTASDGTAEQKLVVIGSSVDPHEDKATAGKSQYLDHTKHEGVPGNPGYNQPATTPSSYDQPSGAAKPSGQQVNHSRSHHPEGFGTGRDPSYQNKHHNSSQHPYNNVTGTSYNPPTPQLQSYPNVPPSRSNHPTPAYQSHPNPAPSRSRFSFFKSEPKQPKRVAVTMVSNRINDMTDGLLRGFIQSLNTADVVYDVQSVEPQGVHSGQQQCIMGCVSASRLLSDVNASMALFTGTKPRQLILVIFHPKAPHVTLHVTTEQKLGKVTDVHAFIDLVFWERQAYSCPVNEQAKADFRRLIVQT